MKKYRALVGAILRVLVIAGMWVWSLTLPSNMEYEGFAGSVLIFLLMLTYSTVLFIGAILRLCDFLALKRRTDVTEAPTKVKTYKSLVSLIVQSAIIVITAGLLVFVAGWWGSLVIIAVFVVLKLIDE